MGAEGGRIDWGRIRDRLRQSEAALDAASAVGPERLAAMYRERAAALAARRVAAAGPVVGPRALVFELAGERYGLDFGDVAELLPFAGCTPVPGGPPELLGAIGVRGEIRSVLDLARMLGLSAGRGRGYVLFARTDGRTAALRVDRVEAVCALSEPPAPHAGTEPLSPFVRGLTADRVRLLDTAAIFAHPALCAAPAAPARPRPGEGGSPP